ncbi:MAG: substrate-binding domain-containing protein [Gammaproteobacteria bacterium]
MMRMLTRSLLVLWLLGGFVCGAAAEELQQPRKGTYLIGFSQDTLGNDWRAAQVRALEQEFSRYPFIKFVYTDGEGDTAKQIQDIEDLIAIGVDVLIASPKDAKAMTPVISRAYRQGIPVILLTRRIETDDFTTFISPDDEAIGRRAAQYLARELKGKGKVLVLQGVPTATTGILRTKGFHDEIAKHPGIEIVFEKPANYLRADAIQVMEEALSKGIAFDAIFSQSDSMADGARRALKKAGIDPKKILIVGIDYIAEARRAILAGEEHATFTYPTCGAEGAQAALKILNNEPVLKIQMVESIMVTRDNVESVEPIF